MEKYIAKAEQLLYNDRIDEGLGMLNDLLYERPGYGSLHNHLGQGVTVKLSNSCRWA
jgi:hypothetical protein